MLKRYLKFQKWKIVNRISVIQSKASKENNTGEKVTSFRKGVKSLLLSFAGLMMWFLGIIFLILNGVGLAIFFGILALIYIGFAIYNGVSAVSTPKDTADLIFGILGLVFSVMFIALMLSLSFI